MILHYTDRSKDDVELAFEWYEKQRRGLGFEFLDSVEMSLIPGIPYLIIKGWHLEKPFFFIKG